MPQDRRTPFVYSPHSQETDVRKPNFLIIDDVQLMLMNYKENPDKWTTEYIAARYEISKETAGSLEQAIECLRIKIQLNTVGFKIHARVK